MRKATLLFVFLLGIMTATCFAQDKNIAKLTKAAEKGDVKAQIELGKCYYNGKNVAKDYAEAFKWFQKAADNGYAEGQYRLGLMYNNGEGTNKNEETSVLLYRKAANQGYAYALKALGVMFENGSGIEKNQDSAKYWYDKAYPEIRRIAESGDAEGERHLGNCYEFSRGVEQSYTESVHWYSKSAEQGYALAQFNLGNCYYWGNGVEQSYTESVHWYRKSAEQGYADAQLNLGFCYDNGFGVEQSYEEAVKWYRKSAEQGNANAQSNLGYCYEYGKGLERNYITAMIWFTKAAENGYMDANKGIVDIAYFHSDYYNDENDNFQKALQKAKSNYMKEINKGNTSAMIGMGDLYFYLDGEHSIEQNINSAITWYKLAISQGDSDGIRALALLYDKVQDEIDHNSLDVCYDTLPDKKNYEDIYKDSYPLWLRAANSGSGEAQAVIGFKNFLEKKFDEAMVWYAKAQSNNTQRVYRTNNVNIRLETAIMLCNYFKKHSTEYDFYFIEDRMPQEYNYSYGWTIEVFQNDNSSNYYVTVTKNNKFGLIKLSEEGNLLEKTPIIYDSRFYYYEDDENGKFHTELNGQDVKFDL